MAELDEHDLELLEICWSAPIVVPEHGGCAKDVQALLAEVRRLRQREAQLEGQRHAFDVDRQRAAAERDAALERAEQDRAAWAEAVKSASVAEGMLAVGKELIRLRAVETAARRVVESVPLMDNFSNWNGVPTPLLQALRAALGADAPASDDGAVVLSSTRYDQLDRVERAVRRVVGRVRVGAEVDPLVAELQAALAAAPEAGREGELLERHVDPRSYHGPLAASFREREKVAEQPESDFEPATDGEGE